MAHIPLSTDGRKNWAAADARADDLVAAEARMEVARARCCAGETSGDSSPGITAEADVGTEDSEMDWPDSEQEE